MSNNLRVFVVTCDSYQWACQPFSYLFNLYWSSLQPIVLAGFSVPQFELPSNFRYHQIDRSDYPPNRWSNGLIRFLQDIPDEYFVLLLEDYWLCRTVDTSGINTLLEYMQMHPEVVRFDLTTDRLYGSGMHDVEAYGHYDIIECAEDAPYQMSLQAAIWKRDLLLQLLKPDKTSWQVEVETNMVGNGMRVLGTRQYPVRFANAILKGELAWNEIGRIPQPHLDTITKMIPKGWRHAIVKQY